MHNQSSQVQLQIDEINRQLSNSTASLLLSQKPTLPPRPSQTVCPEHRNASHQTIDSLRREIIRNSVKRQQK